MSSASSGGANRLNAPGRCTRDVAAASSASSFDAAAASSASADNAAAAQADSTAGGSSTGCTGAVLGASAAA